MKRGRILIFVGLILGLGTMIAAFAILTRVQEPPAVTEAPAPKAQALVALQNIGQAQPFDMSLVELREFEKAQIPADAVLTSNEVAGKIAAYDVVQSQIIRHSMLTDEQQIVEMGVNASFLVPAGKVAVAFPITELSSVAYALQAGDTVDMLISFQFIDVDPDLQYERRPTEDDQPAGDQIPRMATQLTLQDVTVLKVGDWGAPAAAPTADPATQPQQQQEPAQQTRDVPPPSPTIITVVVTQQDALVLKYAREAGASIDFALRARDDHDMVQTEPVNLDYMIQRFNIQPPAKLPVALDMELWPAATD